MRAYSEWSMFCLHWHWDHIQQLDVRFRAKMKFFIQCNATLYGDPSLVRKLPNDELFRYLRKCFKGVAMEYMSNSIYSVCIEGAMRVFKREQFLFLRFEDLMRMKAPALIRLLSNFTGLYTDEKIIRLMQAKQQCEAGTSKKRPLSFTVSASDNASRAVEARTQLRRILPELEDFFGRYNGMLSELVHPAFQWGADTHRV